MLSKQAFYPDISPPSARIFHVPDKKRLPTVISLKLCRFSLIRLFVVLAIISTFLNSPAYSQESEDSQIFISGFNAFQQKDYATTITKMNEVLQKHPDSPLRDMVLFWLSRAYYKSGNQLDAARYMSQFSKEYPDNPLKGTVDEELLALTARYEKGEQLPGGSAPVVAQRDYQEQARLVAAQREQERVAAVKAEAERQAAEKAALAKRAAEEAEQARLAAAQKEQERAAAIKAEADRKAAEKVEQERAAALKAEEERQTAEKAAQLKAESEKVDMELVARQQAEMVRQTMAKAEQKRLAALKAEAERDAAEKAAKAEQKRIALAKVEEERIAAAAEEKRMAALQAEADRLSAEKAEQQRAEREKVEQERRSAAAAESARLAAVRKEQERQAAEKAESQRQAQEKSAMAQRAAEETEQKKQAMLKAEQEQVAAQRIAKERQATAAAETAQQAQEQPRKVAAKAQKQPLARAEKARASKAALREKAIAQYKSIIDKYPASTAAATAAAKLKELGVAVTLPQMAAAESPPENAQILRLEVDQFAALEFKLTSKPQAYAVAQRIGIPFEITNRGNGSDTFSLESGFPAEFTAGFAAAAQPEQAVNQTTLLAPGESFKGVINLAIPSTSIDGLRISYPVKAASRLLPEAAQSREVALTAAAPLLRAVVKTDKVQLLPGEKTTYRVSVLNVGSTAAQGVTLRLNFPPQLEALDYSAAGFRQEMKSSLVLDGLQIKSGESKEFSLHFQLKEDSLAGQELLTRAELVNTPLKTAAVFVSNTAHVQPQHGVKVRTAPERQVVIPGQTLYAPLVVTNTGNVREKFRIVSSVNGAQEAVLFQDLNRDGIRQANEPPVTEVGPLAPQEEVGLVMEITTARSAVDGTQGGARIVFSSEGDSARASSAVIPFVYSRPVLQMAMTARDGRLKPGEVASFDLTITNRGSNLARVVQLQGTWPEQLELIAAEPTTSASGSGQILWNFKEVGAGEKRTIKVSFRVKAGTGVGTSLQVKNLLTYEDQLGNRY